MPTIGKWELSTVHASEIFLDEDCGFMLTTEEYKDRLLLYQDGEATLVSDLMSREKRIFGGAGDGGGGRP